MMESADRTVLLLDHTKFRKSGVYQLAALTDFDLVIVDDDTPEAELTALRAQGVHLHVASTNPDQQDRHGPQQPPRKNLPTANNDRGA